MDGGWAGGGSSSFIYFSSDLDVLNMPPILSRICKTKESVGWELRWFTPDRPTSTDRKNCSLKTSPVKVHLVEGDQFKMVAIAAFIQQFRKMKDKLEEIGALQGHLNLAEQLSKYADFTRDYD
ncbi:Uncharacterized protein Fot_31940 [Forsythia ovata]|uniref:Uncharacterized protein n=1 Tax=Forsythia ovata TaxID=205694 RepID=A0ABD1T6Y3_9LAMI